MEAFDPDLQTAGAPAAVEGAEVADVLNRPTSGPPSPEPKRWRVGTLTYTTTSLVVLFSWLLWGDFAWSMKERALGPVLQLLFIKFHASDMLAGVLIGSVPQAVALFLSPIISYKSDRLRGPWGRRIPFLLLSTPFAVLSIFGLAFSPVLGGRLDLLLGAHTPGRDPAIIFMFGLFWTIFQVATTVSNSVFGALVNDVVPHAVIGRFFGMFRAVSLIAGIIFGWWIMGKAENNFAWIFISTGALYGFGFSAMCFRVQEGDYPPPPLVDPNGGRFLPAARSYFRDCFGHPYYLWFFGATTLSWMAFVPVGLFNVFLAKSVHMDMGTYGRCVGLTYGISLFLSYSLGSLADRFHPLRIGLVSIALYGLEMLWAAFFAADARMFPIALVIHGVLSGTWMTGTAALGQMLLPKMKFAEFASAGGIVGCLGTMSVGPILGVILDRSGHDYRLIFVAGCILSVLAFAATLKLYYKFVALGGPANYVPPGTTY
jgi:MFS family permease